MASSVRSSRVTAAYAQGLQTDCGPLRTVPGALLLVPFVCIKGGHAEPSCCGVRGLKPED